MVPLELKEKTRTWLSRKTMSPGELRTFFKDYCKRWNFTMKDAREYRIWWAMFYTWKDGGWWTEGGG